MVSSTYVLNFLKKKCFNVFEWIFKNLFMHLKGHHRKIKGEGRKRGPQQPGLGLDQGKARDLELYAGLQGGWQGHTYLGHLLLLSQAH